MRPIVLAPNTLSSFLGFGRDVGLAELSGWVTGQDTAALLANCNPVPVRSGDVVFCPGGVPHAIGTGMLVLEIQEMTDFSIMLEWAGFPLDPAGLFLGLDPDTALGAVRRQAVTGEDLQALPYAAGPTVVCGNLSAIRCYPAV